MVVVFECSFCQIQISKYNLKIVNMVDEKGTELIGKKFRKFLVLWKQGKTKN